ncbi:MAG: nucleotidyltransferase [Clostridia bacterium]|nr:nucleotidyltransferase [Clostridia bacterium]
MKVAGLVVEYNPFHNGHLYHLEQSKKLSDADYTVCIMSGNFIQRGEPALVNKWARAKMALLSGIDLVIELPVVYAMASAEYFAYGAVSILDSLGVVDSLCFGSESGSISELDLVAETLNMEPDNYKFFLKSKLNQGLSFPSAREAALIEYFKYLDLDINISTIIGSSNNILGIEYLKALKRIGSSIKPLTIGRICNSYNSEQLTGSVSSATSIRKSILHTSDGLLTPEVSKTLPDTSLSILKEEADAGRSPVFPKNFETALLSFLRRMPAEEIGLLPYVSEGMENRIKAASDSSGSLEELIANINTKRYTRTRIQRILFSIMTGLKAFELHAYVRDYGPQYIRVLGFSQRGRKLLSEIKVKAVLPTIIKTADYKRSCNPLLKRMLEIEAQATDMYVMGYSNPVYRKAGQEFTQNIVII